MKQFGNLRTFIVAGVAVASLSALCAAQAQDMKQNEGVVRKISGNGAKYSTGGGVWAPLHVGDKLPAGSVVQSEPDSTVDIFLGVNGPALRVKADTTVAIDSLSYTGETKSPDIETKLNLQDGEILGSVRKLSAASKYDIKTPTGIAGIRGTDYDIKTRKDAAGKYASTYNCITGSLIGADTQNGQTQSFQANGGEGFDFGHGGIFQLEQQLLNDLKGQIQIIIVIVGPSGGGGHGEGHGPWSGGSLIAGGNGANGDGTIIIHFSPILPTSGSEGQGNP